MRIRRVMFGDINQLVGHPSDWHLCFNGFLGVSCCWWLIRWLACDILVFFVVASSLRWAPIEGCWCGVSGWQSAYGELAERIKQVVPSSPPDAFKTHKPLLPGSSFPFALLLLLLLPLRWSGSLSSDHENIIVSDDAMSHRKLLTSNARANR